MTVKRNILLLGFLLVTILAIGGVWLYAQQVPQPEALARPTTHAATEASTSTVAQVLASNSSTAVTPAAATTTPIIGTTAAIPSMIGLSATETVMIVAQITDDSSLIPGSVNLLRPGTSGAQPVILGELYDDGTHGDAIAGDHLYSGEFTFHETIPSQVSLQVSAAFRGYLKRVISGAFSISVNPVYVNTSTGISFINPTDSVVGYNATSDYYTITAATLPTIPILTLSIASQSPQNPDSWFTNEVDPAGVLLSSGSVQRMLTSGGYVEYLFVSTPGPEYTDTNGPVPFAFVISPDGTTIITITGSPEGDALASLGYSNTQAQALRQAIIGSIGIR